MSCTRAFTRWSLIAATGLAAILAACGGGGGGGGSDGGSPPTGEGSASSSHTSSTASASSSSASSSSGAFEDAPAKNGYDLTFNENFNSLDVSADGPGTRWTAHTPWWGDFGDAQFANPEPGFPFTTQDGILRIEARKGADGKWRSGLLASVDHKNVGFSQQYGYFEMRAKLPSGNGVWPAFWLDSMVPPEFDDPSLEVDVLEYYGQFNTKFHSTVTLWPKGNKGATSQATVTNVAPDALSNDFHIYAVSVEPDWIEFFFDGQKIWQTPTPSQHKHKMMILVNLALGGGWPITDTPSPSYMYVDYIRAYQKKPVTN